MKTVLKWNPYLDLDLSAQEGWLEELDREGLSVRFRLGSLAVCDRGEPHPGRRFRIEPARTRTSASDPPAEELTELYEEAGWHYLRRFPGGLGELFYTDDPAALEPYTDSETRALAMENLRKHFRRSLFLLFLIGLWCLLKLYWLPPASHAALRSFWAVFFLFYVILTLFYHFLEWRTLERTFRRQALGVEKTLPPSRRLCVFKGVVDVLTGLACIFLILLTVS